LSAVRARVEQVLSGNDALGKDGLCGISGDLNGNVELATLPSAGGGQDMVHALLLAARRSADPYPDTEELVGAKPRLDGTQAVVTGQAASHLDADYAHGEIHLVVDYQQLGHVRDAVAPDQADHGASGLVHEGLGESNRQVLAVQPCLGDQSEVLARAQVLAMTLS
jgi:hypothetical protein